MNPDEQPEPEIEKKAHYVPGTPTAAARIHEVLDMSESQRVEAAIQRAVELGIASLGVVNEGGTRQIVMLYVPHMNYSDDEHTRKTAQVVARLAQVSYCFTDAGVHSPHFLDSLKGEKKGKLAFSSIRFQDKKLPFDSSECRARLLTDLPGLQSLVLSAKGDPKVPDWAFSASYAVGNYYGLYSQKFLDRMAEFMRIHQPMATRFLQEFRFATKLADPRGNIQIQVQTAWDEEGRPVLDFGNGRVMYCSGVISLCDDFIETLRLKDELLREQTIEITRTLLSTSADQIPIVEVTNDQYYPVLQAMIEANVKVNVMAPAMNFEPALPRTKPYTHIHGGFPIDFARAIRTTAVSVPLRPPTVEPGALVMARQADDEPLAARGEGEEGSPHAPPTREGHRRFVPRQQILDELLRDRRTHVTITGIALAMPEGPADNADEHRRYYRQYDIPESGVRLFVSDDAVKGTYVEYVDFEQELEEGAPNYGSMSRLNLRRMRGAMEIAYESSEQFQSALSLILTSGKRAYPADRDAYPGSPWNAEPFPTEECKALLREDLWTVAMLAHEKLGRNDPNAVMKAPWELTVADFQRAGRSGEVFFRFNAAVSSATWLDNLTATLMERQDGPLVQRDPVPVGPQEGEAAPGRPRRTTLGGRTISGYRQIALRTIQYMAFDAAGRMDREQ